MTASFQGINSGAGANTAAKGTFAKTEDRRTSAANRGRGNAGPAEPADIPDYSLPDKPNTRGQGFFAALNQMSKFEDKMPHDYF